MNELGKVGKPELGKPRSGSVTERLAKAKATSGGSELPVLKLLLDCSGSMSAYSDSGENYGKSESRIEILRQAVKGFINDVDLAKYRVGIDSFPHGVAHCPPTSIQLLLTLAADSAEATGETPMGAAIAFALRTEPKAERCVIISDGDSTDNALKALRSESENPDGSENGHGENIQYPQNALAKRSLPTFDCVHIGDSGRGEETLKEIARLTGGVYLKFKDLDAFRKGFKYLTPRYRAMLLSGDVSALTGASEVSR